MTGHAGPGDVCRHIHFSRSSDCVIEPLAESGGSSPTAQFLPSFFCASKKEGRPTGRNLQLMRNGNAAGGPFRRTKGAGPLWNPWLVSGVAAAEFMRPHNPRSSCNPANGNLWFCGSWLNDLELLGLLHFSKHTPTVSVRQAAYELRLSKSINAAWQAKTFWKEEGKESRGRGGGTLQSEKPCCGLPGFFPDGFGREPFEFSNEGGGEAGER